MPTAPGGTSSNSRSASDPHPLPASDPWDHDAEAALVGAAMGAPDARARILDAVPAANLHDVRLALIYKAVAELHAERRAILPELVAERLGDQRERAGGIRWITDLYVAGPAFGHRELIGIVNAHARTRRAQMVVAEISDDIRLGKDWAGRALELERLREQALDAGADTSALRIANLEAILTDAEPEQRPLWLRDAAGGALLYPGRYHDLHGEPSGGKTWIAYHAASQALEDGQGLVFIDWEDTPQTFAGRMLAVGVSALTIINPERVAYLQPEGPLGPVELARITRIIEGTRAGLVIFDALAPALALDGADESSNPDVTGWVARVIRPITRMGVAVLAIDHVPKNPDRPRGGRGAGAKLATIDGASYEVLATKAFSRKRAGSVKLRIAKDRPGHVGPVGEIASHYTLTPGKDGALIIAAADPDSLAFRPTFLMEQISRFLERLPARHDPPSTKDLLKAVKGKDAAKRTALRILAEEDYVQALPDPRTSTGRLYRSVSAYRASDEEPRPEGPPPEPDPEPPLYDNEEIF